MKKIFITNAECFNTLCSATHIIFEVTDKDVDRIKKALTFLKYSGDDIRVTLKSIGKIIPISLESIKDNSVVYDRLSELMSKDLYNTFVEVNGLENEKINSVDEVDNWDDPTSQFVCTKNFIVGSLDGGSDEYYTNFFDLEILKIK